MADDLVDDPGQDGDTGQGDKPPVKKSWQQEAIELVKTIAYALLIALTVRTFAYEPFNIPSGSMIPTLLIGDYLFVSKLSYGYSKYSFPFGFIPFEGRIFEDRPERGDVAVFRQPTNTDIDYIKRIIGLPGDRIQVKSGILHINGEPVQRKRAEDYVTESGSVVRQYIEVLPNGREHRIIEAFGDNGQADNTQEYVVPAGHYFAMGDNRDRSQDSRYLSDVGYVPAENLIGRAEFLFFSIGDGFDIRFGRILNGIE